MAKSSFYLNGTEYEGIDLSSTALQEAQAALAQALAAQATVAASEAAAAASAGLSAASAATAASEADEAAAEADEAAGHASAADGHRAAAASSASGAASSASTASTHATAAAGSASAAAGSATASATSASGAASSASAADASASAAAGSASAAAGSASAAATSAASAASATNAAIRHDTSQALSSAAQAVALKNIGAATLLINGKVVTSVAAGALTVALKALDGSDPSPTNPVGVYIRDTSGSSTVVWLTTAASVALASGASAGVSVASRAFNLWLLGINDAGTLRLGLINCLKGQSVYPLRGLSTLSSTAGSGSNAHTVYSGVGVTSKAFAVLARLEWSSGLATPGTWASTPSKIVLHQTGTALPGDVAGFSEILDVTTRTTTSTSFVATGITADLLPSSPANPIRITFMGGGDCDSVGNTISFDVNRGATSLVTLFGRDVLVGGAKQGSGSGLIPQSFGIMDFPNSTALLTFSLMFRVTSGTATLAARNGGAVTTITTFRVEEIMS